MSDSTKPKKPRKGLPVFLRPSGQYGWKFRDRFHYFGTDPGEAVEEYLRTKDDMRAGKRDTGQSSADGLGAGVRAEQSPVELPERLNPVQASRMLWPKTWLPAADLA